MTGTYAIVAAVDLSEVTDVVLEHAFDAARRHAGAELHVLSVAPTGRGIFHRTRDHDAELEELGDRVRARLAEIAPAFAPSDAEPAMRVLVHLRAGVPVEEILELAADVEAELIVLGRHGWDGAGGVVLGAVSERVLRRARCSVLLVNPAAKEARESAETQCAACITSRRDSGGERWFCERHVSHGRVGLFMLGGSGGGASLRPGGVF